MSYEPIKDLEPVPEEVEDKERESREIGVETDVFFSPCAADETLSFLDWNRSADSDSQKNTNPARMSLYNMGASRGITIFCVLLPWIICLILVVEVAVLAWKLDSASKSTSSLPPADVMYSE